MEGGGGRGTGGVESVCVCWGGVRMPVCVCVFGGGEEGE